MGKCLDREAHSRTIGGVATATRSAESSILLLLEHHKRGLTCDHSTCRRLTKLGLANMLVEPIDRIHISKIEYFIQ